VTVLLLTTIQADVPAVSLHGLHACTPLLFLGSQRAQFSADVDLRPVFEENEEADIPSRRQIDLKLSAMLNSVVSTVPRESFFLPPFSD